MPEVTLSWSLGAQGIGNEIASSFHGSTNSSTLLPTVTKPLNINFSEFEAESDPFEKAELQTLG